MRWLCICNYPRPNKPDEVKRDPYDYLANHYVSDQLCHSVYQSLLRRRIPYLRIEKLGRTPVSVDLGGIAMTDRHLRRINIEGLVIEVPSGQVPEIVRHIKSFESRNEIGFSYYKIHFWFRRCLCLSPSQRDLLLRRLTKILPECEAIESAENKVFNQRIASMPGPHAIRKRPVKIKPGRA